MAQLYQRPFNYNMKCLAYSKKLTDSQLNLARGTTNRKKQA